MPLLPLLALLILPKAAPRKVAVIVGVSGYLVPTEKRTGGFESLRFAHLDAARMAKRLEGLGWETTLLQGFPDAKASAATKAGILGALKGLNTSEGDTVLFYFSGHGIRVDGRDYLVPADGRFADESADPDVPKWKAEQSTLLSAAELTDAFEGMRADKRLLVVDACRDEPKIGKNATGPDGRLNQAKLGETVQVSRFGATSSAVMFSCKPGQRSYEDPRLQGGVFTNAWLAALDSGRVTNADGDVSLEQLNVQLRKRVAAWSAANDGLPMSPNMETKMEDPIVLGRLAVASGGSAVLMPTRARLVVTADAPDASITVDGLASGLTYEGEVPAGGTKQVTVVVSAPGRESATYPVTLEAGKETTLRAELSATDRSPSTVPRFDYSLAELEKSVEIPAGRVWLSPNGLSAIYATTARKQGKYLNDLFIQNFESKRQITFPNLEGALTFSESGAVMARWALNDDSVDIWELPAGKLRTTLKGPNQDRADAVALSPDGTVCAMATELNDALVLILWDTRTGERQKTLKLEVKDLVQNVVFSPNGLHLLVTGREAVEVFDMGSLDSPVLLKTYSESGECFSPDSRSFALSTSSSSAGRLSIYDAQSGERIMDLSKAVQGNVRVLAFSPDGATLVVSEPDPSGTATAWRTTLIDIASGEVAGHLPASVLGLSFGPDGSMMLAFPSDKRSKDGEAMISVKLYRTRLRT